MPVQVLFVLCCLLFLTTFATDGCTAAGDEQVRIDADARVPENPRSRYSRYVNWRPANGELVDLNPPRMSWPLWPDWPNNWSDASHTFALQISSRPDCSRPMVDVTSPLNFYNTLPELKGAAKWYWRVGYDVGTDDEQWSEVRSFAIGADAVVWDRSALAEPGLAERGHPRILFNNDTLEKMRALAQTDPGSAAAMQWMREQADEILTKPWWDDFPATDRDPDKPRQQFYTIAGDLALVAFVCPRSAHVSPRGRAPRRRAPVHGRGARVEAVRVAGAGA